MTAGRVATSNAWLVLCVLLGGLVGALPLVVLTPPLQVPDEAQHLQRAYQLSEGDLLGIVQNGAAGAILPASLGTFTERALGTRDLHVSTREVTRRPFGDTLRLLSTPLDPDERVFLDFRGAAAYSPLPYLPQALAIAVARQAGAGPLGLLWAGRVANAVVAVALVAAAVALIPVGQAVMALAALLPMSLFQFASVSADAMVIACAFLFTAFALRGVVRGGWTRRETLAAAMAGLVFCSVKPPYLPLLLLPACLALRHGRAAHAMMVQAVILAIALGGTLLWMAEAHSVFVSVHSSTSPEAQAARLITAPWNFVATVLASIRAYALFYALSGIGILGWLNVWLPMAAYLLAAFGLLLALLVVPAGAARLRWVEALCCALLVAGSVILIFAVVYIYWNPIGSTLINGVQGRYFIPLVGAVGAILVSMLELASSPGRLKAYQRLFVLTLLAVAMMGPLAVIQAYDVLGGA